MADAATLRRQRLTLPYDLADAIASRLEGLPEISGPGAFTAIGLDTVGGAKMPYLVISNLATTPKQNSGAEGYYEYLDLRFTAYAGSGQTATVLGDALKGALSPKALEASPLRFQSGYLMTILYRGGQDAKFSPASRSANASLVFLRVMNFRAKVGRPG